MLIDLGTVSYDINYTSISDKIVLFPKLRIIALLFFLDQKCLLSPNNNQDLTIFPVIRKVKFISVRYREHPGCPETAE